MFMEWVLLAIGLIGFGLGGYWDLKTTEFPDWLPYSMIIGTLLVRGIFAWYLQVPGIFLESLLIGLVFLGFGMLLYLTRQWGDGDAWFLGALGFLFPEPTGFLSGQGLLLPFPLVMLVNFFLVAFGYMIIYSIVLGIKSRTMSRRFWKSLEKDLKGIIYIVLGFTIACLVILLYSNHVLGLPFFVLSHILVFPPLLVLVILFSRYGKFIERNLFKKRISVKELKEGDVLISDRWRGLTKKEVSKLKRKGGHIWIKEGVRFAPVFVITLIITLFFGSILGLLI